MFKVVDNYYLDTCIWLNLWKKEEGNGKILFWKAALELYNY